MTRTALYELAFRILCFVGRPFGGIRPRRIYDWIGRQAFAFKPIESIRSFVMATSFAPNEGFHDGNRSRAGAAKYTVGGEI